MMNPAPLEELGLTHAEAIIYITLLEMGATSAGPLIKRVGMHRAAVYNLLDLLIEKGMVGYALEGKIKVFLGHEPSRLREYLEQQKTALAQREQRVEAAIGELEKKRQKSPKEQQAILYRGTRGLKSICEDVLKSKPAEWRVFGSTGMFKHTLPEYFEVFQRKRAEQNIRLKILYHEEVRKEHKEKQLRNAEIRYLPQQYNTPTTTWVYHDKVVIIQWGPLPIAVLVQSESAAQSQSSFFEILWQNASP